jgi:hypothetical protein
VIKEHKEDMMKRIDSDTDETEINESVSDSLAKVTPTIADMNFRPFTPPFAQFRSLGKTKKERIEKEDEKLDVIYDSILKCYYEPSTGNYYQSNKE